MSFPGKANCRIHTQVDQLVGQIVRLPNEFSFLLRTLTPNCGNSWRQSQSGCCWGSCPEASNLRVDRHSCRLKRYRWFHESSCPTSAESALFHLKVEEELHCQALWCFRSMLWRTIKLHRETPTRIDWFARAHRICNYIFLLPAVWPVS